MPEDKSPNPVDLFVGGRIRNRRRALGHSQEHLADALGLTFQQVQKYERGANRVSASKLYAIAVNQGVGIGYYFEGLPADGNVSRETLAEDIAQMAAVATIPNLSLATKLSGKERRVVGDVIAALAGWAAHPDSGGSAAAMADLNRAKEDALKALEQ